MTAIETNGLTKRFGDVVAVDDLDLRVAEGEVFGFLGPNGAGKSTVINVLLDLVRPTAGSVTVLGHDPRTDADRIRRRTGVLPEGSACYERLTGREHLEWIARANGVDDEEDVDALLARVGLSSEAADRRAGGYSTGMRQRLAFAMALIGDPDLLILDEPSTGLDPTGMRELREIVREEAAAGRTVFFSSHLLREVEAVADRIGIMNEGRLAAVGTPDELRSSLDLGGRIEFDVDRVPDPDAIVTALETTAGVERVRLEGETVAVRVSDPTAKIDAARRLAERAEVRDIVSAERSLERLFDTYTSAGSDGERAAPLESGAEGNADRRRTAPEVSR